MKTYLAKLVASVDIAGKARMHTSNIHVCIVFRNTGEAMGKDEINNEK